MGVLKVVTPLIRRRQLLGALALVGTCLTLTSCTKDEFTIEGTWKSTGDNSWGLMSKGSVVTFADGHTALFSPNDSYAFYEENGTYHLDVTGMLGSGGFFIVTIVDDDNIELATKGSTEPTLVLTRIG